MKQQISLREANQRLSQYIGAVERGEEVVITRRGKPIARIVAISRHRKPSAEQMQAWARLKSSARKLRIGRPQRDELHER
jgi:prevent-host-death family protein